MLFDFFHCVNIYIDGTKAMVGKITRTLARIKAMAPTVLIIIVVSLLYILSKGVLDTQ